MHRAHIAVIDHITGTGRYWLGPSWCTGSSKRPMHYIVTAFLFSQSIALLPIFFFPRFVLLASTYSDYYCLIQL